jgi:hypothetical protein
MTVGVLGILVAVAVIELAMGRVPWCTCHHLRLWVGSTKSPELSQQIADWYSFSHIIHGFAFYAIARWLGRRWSLGSRFVLATLIEAAWEILENSPIIIDRYRHTAAQGYTGDSVVNSISDILFCLIGFWLAAKLPVWVILCLIVVMEVGVGLTIRDNLTLNIIMLLHPFEGIRRWQMGA